LICSKSIFRTIAVAAVLASTTGLISIPGITLAAHAQETGQIAGTVTDPSGAVIPNVSVTAQNVGTNASRTVTSNSSGSYIFTNLSPATYDITATVSGFNSYKARVEVTVGGRLTLDPKLSVGSGSTTVEVTAEGGTQVNTQTQEISQIVDQAQVSSFPSLTRNPYDFVAISGNVSAGDASSNNMAQNATTRGVGFGLNGQRTTGTEILLDGVENLSVFGDAVGIVVPLDAVQEFRVITSNFEPQYGRASGGIVNVTTKTGTNAFHGTAYGFNRISDLTANTVFNAQNGIPRGHYTRNQFGGEAGGPIVKDKLFFLGDVEFTRIRSAANQAALIPTPQFLAQAAPNVQAYFTAYGTNAPTSNVFVTNSQLPAAYSNLAPTFPVFQQISFTSPTNAGGGIPQNTYNIVGRVDYNLSSTTQTFFRYVDYSEVDQNGGNFSSPYSQYNVGGTNKNQAYLLNLTHEFTPALTSVTKLSFSRFNSSYSYNTALQNVPTLVVFTNAQVNGTSIQLPGFYDFNPANGGLPYGGPQDTTQINQDVNFVHGKHSIQGGAQIVYIQDNNAYGAYAQAEEELGNNLNNGLAALQSGALFQFEAAVNPKGALPCVAEQYTQTYTQTPGCSITLPASSPSFARSERFHDWAAYAQDAWKMTPRFTFNYGVRYEYFGVQHNDNHNLDSNFYYGGNGVVSPANIRSGQVYTTPTSPAGALWKPQYGTVSPRIGFAYDIFGDGKSSFRAGYGISYERNFGNVTFNVIQNPPNYGVIVQNNVTVTNSNLGPLGAATGSVPLPPTSLRNVDENIRTAQTQFWSGALEHQVAANTVVSIEYTGSRGLHLYDIKNYNGYGSGNVLLGDPVTDPNPPAGTIAKKHLTRLNPQYSNINNRGSGGDSYYNAMNIEFQTTNLYHTGLSVVANYTLAHAFDDLSTTFSETNNAFSLGYTNPFNPSLDRGPSDFDIRNRLVVAPLYRTPSYHGGKGMMNELIGGYEVTGIFTARTGTPFTYYDTTNNYSGYNYARYTPASGPITQHTFKSIPAGVSSGGTDSYVIGSLPAANSWGNPALLGYSDWGPYPSTMTARNAFRGPGAWNLDASVSKQFPVTERVNLELRAEGFNVFNHHNLYIQEGLNDVANTSPGVPVITASKGGIGSGGPNDERRFLQFAGKINF
jgi:hypothetical protein